MTGNAISASVTASALLEGFRADETRPSTERMRRRASDP